MQHRLLPIQVAFGGVGQDGILSDGIPDSSLHELLNVRVEIILQLSNIRRSESRLIVLRMFCAVGAHAPARLHDAELGAGGCQMDGYFLMHVLRDVQPGQHDFWSTHCACCPQSWICIPAHVLLRSNMTLQMCRPSGQAAIVCRLVSAHRRLGTSLSNRPVEQTRVSDL